MRPARQEPLHPTTSVYLDAVRFLAAVAVFLSHAHYTRFDGAWVGALGTFGRDAVIVFFVLSGFVIAYATSTKERDARTYAVRRLARLYSVVLPALILTVVLDQIGLHLDPGQYQGGWYEDSHPVPRFMLSVLFANELWFWSIRPFSNGPFWSLGYEAAYYLLFGVALFAPKRYRSLVVVIAALVVGPKVLLLLPIWLLGVATYAATRRHKLRPLPAALVLLTTLLGYAWYHHADIGKTWMLATADLLGHSFVFQDLRYSKFFLGWYVVGALTALNFWAADSIARHLPPLHAGTQHAIRLLAGFTFSLYLYHYPLLQFVSTIIQNGPLTALLAFVSCFVLGSFTETRKRPWIRLFDALLTRLSRARPIPLANPREETHGNV